MNPTMKARSQSPGLERPIRTGLQTADIPVILKGARQHEQARVYLQPGEVAAWDCADLIVMARPNPPTLASNSPGQDTRGDRHDRR